MMEYDAPSISFFYRTVEQGSVCKFMDNNAVVH